jgi:hypothetical protein
VKQKVLLFTNNFIIYLFFNKHNKAVQRYTDAETRPGQSKFMTPPTRAPLACVQFQSWARGYVDGVLTILVSNEMDRDGP